MGADGLEALYAAARRADPQTASGWIRHAGSTGIECSDRAGDWSFDEDDFRIHWYADGKLNLSVNSLDRHLAKRGDQTAIIFEADEPGDGRTITYRELHAEACRFANCS